jgi:hypothetical protein
MMIGESKVNEYRTMSEIMLVKSQPSQPASQPTAAMSCRSDRQIPLSFLKKFFFLPENTISHFRK